MHLGLYCLRPDQRYSLVDAMHNTRANALRVDPREVVVLLRRCVSTRLFNLHENNAPIRHQHYKVRHAALCRARELVDHATFLC